MVSSKFIHVGEFVRISSLRLTNPLCGHATFCLSIHPWTFGWFLPLALVNNVVVNVVQISLVAAFCTFEYIPVSRIAASYDVE